MSARRGFWLRARGRSKTQDAGADSLALMLAADWGHQRREVVIDEAHHFEDTPENRAYFDRLQQRLRERDTDPLTVECPWCQEPPGNRCGTVNAYARQPHKARVRLALQMAAHADPALDEWPQLGPVSPCGICGSGLPQRHRMVDAIAGHLEAGEDPDEIAEELDQPEGAVIAVQTWMARWPGAWK